jgi:hypothetical protein
MDSFELQRALIDLSIIHYTHIFISRHSGEGRNPVNQKTHAVGQSSRYGFARCTALLIKLDSGLRRNDVVVNPILCRPLWKPQ